MLISLLVLESSCVMFTTTIPSSTSEIKLKFDINFMPEWIEGVNQLNVSKHKKNQLLTHIAVISKNVLMTESSMRILCYFCVCYYGSDDLIDFELVGFLEIYFFIVNTLISKELSSGFIDRIYKRMAHFKSKYDPIGFAVFSSKILIGINIKKNENKKNLRVVKKREYHRRVLCRTGYKRNYPLKLYLLKLFYLFVYKRAEFCDDYNTVRAYYYFKGLRKINLKLYMERLCRRKYQRKKLQVEIKNIKKVLRDYNRAAHYRKLKLREQRIIIRWCMVYMVYFNGYKTLNSFLDTSIIYVLYKKRTVLTLQSFTIIMGVAKMVHDIYYKILAHITSKQYSFLFLFMDCVVFELYAIQQQPNFSTLPFKNYSRLRNSAILAKFSCKQIKTFLGAGIYTDSLASLYFMVFFKNSVYTRERKIGDMKEFTTMVRNVQSTYKSTFLKIIYGKQVSSIFRKWVDLKDFLSCHERFPEYKKLHNALFITKQPITEILDIYDERVFSEYEVNRFKTKDCIIL